MAKEIVPSQPSVELNELTVLRETPKAHELFTPVVPRTTADSISTYHSADDKKSNIEYFSYLFSSMLLPPTAGFIFYSATSGISLLASVGAILLNGIAINPLVIRLMQKKAAKKYGKVYNEMLETNFNAFCAWLKSRYNVTPDLTAMHDDDLLFLKEVISKEEPKIEYAWFTDISGITYHIKTNIENEFYIVRDVTGEPNSPIVLTEIKNAKSAITNNIVEDLLGDELKGLWDALMNRITLVESYGLSVEKTHTVNRVKQDCQELLTTVERFNKLNLKPAFKEVETLLNSLNNEIQEVITYEASELEQNLRNQVEWVTTRSTENMSPLKLASPNHTEIDTVISDETQKPKRQLHNQVLYTEAQQASSLLNENVSILKTPFSHIVDENCKHCVNHDDASSYEEIG